MEYCLSASLYVIAINPFLLDFQQCIIDASYGVLDACADDFGGALVQIKALLQLERVFDVMSKVSGLVLQLFKCVLVPLVPSESRFSRLYQTWLRLHIPDWTSFKIVTHAEYLGFEIGPAAGSYQWARVLNSVACQVATLSTCALPPLCVCFFFQYPYLPKILS